ncbi:NIPSNAP family containing protein [Acidobacteria bacterium Mor1]|nr:NIPSNAP family containing protein [Acidobacteria bacterium Mor1]
MITCYLRYTLDPAQLAAFEDYSRRWVSLVTRFGGTHHGYFLPGEGANDEAVALFSFPTLADYERYRRDSLQDPECVDAYRLAEETGCIRRYDRSFLRPLLDQGQRGV